MSIKEKIEGNELDLSLNQLSEVPVKELASATKATHLDLSCNRIQSLPNDFVSLTHLVKIDLSRNQLIGLPLNFGNLVNLQYLDLYQNQLKNVPVSFCRLKNLRWLDLKNNPLELKLKAIAGDCLDEKQCQSCAKKVVTYMQAIESDMEREKQKNLKEMREKEAIQRAKMEKELEEQRKQKKLEKEKRKAESRARREEKSIENKLEQNPERSGDNHDAEDKEGRIAQSGGGVNWLLFFFVSIVLAAAAILYSCYLETATVAQVQVMVREFIAKWSKRLAMDSKFIIPYIVDIKTSILRAVHYTMLSVSNFASNIELFLSIYF